jgi:hypothetical protein
MTQPDVTGAVQSDPAQARRQHHKICKTEAAKRPGRREALCGKEYVGPLHPVATSSALCSMCADLWSGHLPKCLPCLERQARKLRRGH